MTLATVVGTLWLVFHYSTLSSLFFAFSCLEPLFHNNILLSKCLPQCLDKIYVVWTSSPFPLTNICSTWMKPICYFQYPMPYRNMYSYVFWRTKNDNDTLTNNVDNYKVSSILVNALHKNEKKGFLSLLDLLLKLFCEGKKSPLKNVSILLLAFLFPHEKRFSKVRKEVQCHLKALVGSTLLLKPHHWACLKQKNFFIR